MNPYVPRIPILGTPVVGVTPNGRDPEYSAAYLEFCKRDHGIASWMFGEVVHMLLRPSRVVEFGCGTGWTLAALHHAGVGTVAGYDISPAARLYMQEIAPDAVGLIRERDLNEEGPSVPRWTYDVAICIEVLEHLRPESADRAVADICNAAPIALVTACPPVATHGNPLHLNEEPWPRWVERFADNGMVIDEQLTAAFKGVMKGLHDLGAYTVPAWYFSDYFGAFVREEG